MAKIPHYSYEKCVSLPKTNRYGNKTGYITGFGSVEEQSAS
jgi:hypothetical protein